MHGKIVQRGGNNVKPWQVWQAEAAMNKPGDLEMAKYEVVIYWSDDDQAFVAEAPELSGCAAHGSTQETVLIGVKEAIRLWIKTAQDLGHAVPQPKGRRLISA
jgi:predicted RNase H-like HicB family nuclease